jgi:glycosyltransferase Alg8
MILGFYILALAALFLHMPDSLIDPAARPVVLSVGVIVLWRYGWGAVHFVRAQIYKRHRFPRLRAAATRLAAATAPDDGRLPPVYLVCTSYRIRAETSRTTGGFRRSIWSAPPIGFAPRPAPTSSAR